MRRLLLALALILCSTAAAQATTYYVAASGADTNNGTAKATPWLHAPGMVACSNTCASTTPHAGDSIIFRGGDTWHFGTNISPYVGSMSGWTWTWSGSAGNQIYVGVDKTWFSGGAWARPIMAGDNPLWNGTSWPTSCAHDFGSAGGMIELAADYITFDNFENSGTCATGSTGVAFFSQGQGGSGHHGLILSNNYAHGWTLTSSTTGNYTFFNSLGSISGETTNQIIGNTVDGVDSPHWMSGATCLNDPSQPCATGEAVYGWAWSMVGNTFRYVSDISVTLNTSIVHDNTFEYLMSAWSAGAVSHQHSNVMNNLGGAAGENFYFYNNIIRHTFATQAIYFGVRTNLYFYNNVMYDNMNTQFGVLSGGCIRLNKVSNSTSSVTAYIYNNTNDDSCQFKFEIANSPLVAWNGVGNFENNHLINLSPASLSSVYICATGGTCTINDNGHEIYQTTAVANSQGYTAANAYAPTSTSGATYHAGADLTSLCATFGSALCSGINSVSRGSTWDSGAYEFSSAPTAPTITSAASTTFTEGVLGSFTVTATGSPTLVFSESGSLPTGVTFNTSTHVLGGTPGAGTAGSYPITFTVTNGTLPDAHQSFTLTVSTVAPPPAQVTPLLLGAFPAGTVGTAYSALEVSASGGTQPYSWAINPTVPGLVLSAPTGLLSGTPATAGTYAETFTVTDSSNPNQSASVSASLTVNPATPPSGPQLGDRIQVVNAANIRATAMANGYGAKLGVEPSGALGTVVGAQQPGPEFNWVQIQFDSCVTSIPNCTGWMGTDNLNIVTIPPPPPPVVTITISPTSANLQTGATRQFSDTVTGSNNTAVTWSTTIGTINASGLFTAPATAGTGTVTVTSQADATKSASATVTVTAPPPPPNPTITCTTNRNPPTCTINGTASRQSGTVTVAPGGATGTWKRP